MGLEINKKKRLFMIISQKPYNENECVKLGTYNFERVKDCTQIGTVLMNKNGLRPEELQMQMEHIMHFFPY
jgi:hypothetical protein